MSPFYFAYTRRVCEFGKTSRRPRNGRLARDGDKLAEPFVKSTAIPPALITPSLVRGEIELTYQARSHGSERPTVNVSVSGHGQTHVRTVRKSKADEDQTEKMRNRRWNGDNRKSVRIVTNKAGGGDEEKNGSQSRFAKSLSFAVRSSVIKQERGGRSDSNGARCSARRNSDCDCRG